MAMSEAHKQALARGRRESRAIKLYLQAIADRRPGRPVTPDTLRKRIDALDAKIDAADDPLKAVEFRQARLEAERRLAQAQNAAAMDDLEAGFVEHARPYSERKGISYAAWRESGVSAAILKKAGISRSG